MDYLISCSTQWIHKCRWNDELRISIPCPSRSVNVLLMASQLITQWIIGTNNSDTGAWKVISNSLNIALFTVIFTVCRVRNALCYMHYVICHGNRRQNNFGLIFTGKQQLSIRDILYQVINACHSVCKGTAVYRRIGIKAHYCPKESLKTTSI